MTHAVLSPTGREVFIGTGQECAEWALVNGLADLIKYDIVPKEEQ